MDIIKFSAPWCSPCKTYQSEWNEVVKAHENDSDVKFIEINVDDDESGLVQKYDVRTIPTTIITDERDIYFRGTGVIKSTNLIKEIWKAFEKSNG